MPSATSPFLTLTQPRLPPEHVGERATGIVTLRTASESSKGSRQHRRGSIPRAKAPARRAHASVNSAGDDRAEEPEDRQPDEDGYDLFDGCAHPPSCLKSADRQAGLLREQFQEGGLLGLGRQSAANVNDAKRRSCDFLQISRGTRPL